MRAAFLVWRQLNHQHLEKTVDKADADQKMVLENVGYFF